MSSGPSSSKSSNAAAAQDALSSIPAEARELVRRVKEIVGCPEQEIYLALQECHMNPDDAVDRLLSQDSFREVKSRKEKKKGTKETSESRLRNVNTTSSHGGRGGTYRHDGRGTSTQLSSYDTGNLHGKPAYKKEHESVDSSTSSTPAYGMRDNTINRQRLPFSASGRAENKPQTTGTFDGISSPSQPSPGHQPAWGGPPGQVSMAHIVKTGGRKALGTPSTSTDYSHDALKTGAPGASKYNARHPIAPAPPPQEAYDGLEKFHEPSFEVSKSIQEAGHPVSQASPDEWNEQSSSRGEPSATGEVFADPSASSNSDRTKLQPDSWSDEVQEPEREVRAEHNDESYIGSASASGREIHGDNSFKNVSSSPHQRQTSEHHEGDRGSSQLPIPDYSVSSVDDVNIALLDAAETLHQLSLQEEQGVRLTEANPTAVIPNQPQIPAAGYPHLSFGSFGSIANESFPGSYVSNSAKSDLEETSVAVNTTSSDHTEPRIPEYFGDEHLESTSGENTAPRASADTGSYGSSTQPEIMNQNTGEAMRGQEYNFPTSVPGYMLDSNLQLNSAFHYEQANPHNIADLSSVMEAYSNALQGNPLAPSGQQRVRQAYANSLQSNPLVPTGQPGRESSDLTYSSFLSTQSVPTNYSTTISSMPENVNPGMISLSHPTAETPPGTNIGMGPAVPQHLVHPYQPTLPLGHFANMVGYPFLPQNYAYIPHAYQQAYAHNVIKYCLPQYKSSVPASSGPQSASVASGYGGFGSSANIPGGFTLNPSTTSSSAAIGHDDVMSSQYKESSHFIPIQQGPDSRTVSALPPSAYYSFQGQGQQHTGFQQAQQPPQQHYGNMGYQNFYHSQAGGSQEHQQQTQSDGTVGGSHQGKPSEQSHQRWQHPY